ncbi:FAD-dependent monooxygenase [Francisella sp. 19X1-34]|uniref:FAD-dependent monooxygenase n=1 Tax=Francisella sp. 19X1-34 TaxID=3087177 RepID=UPI002E2EFA19|nr:FAD-dependent monooxygenase [Francisella sp. 19X1-34]MED7787443.1 FAD-dependent monooxygenase [Francisella sp. 19X1-34]
MDSVLVEKEPTISKLGLGIALPANPTKALAYLGLKERVLDFAYKVDEISYSKPSGELLSKASLNEGDLAYSEFIALMRKDLIKVLNSSDFKIHFDCSIESLENQNDKVFTKFTNGEENIWDLVIAADGINSRVRELSFGQNIPKEFNIRTWRFLADLDIDNRQPNYYIGRDTAFMIYPLTGSKVYCYAHQCNATKNDFSLEETFREYCQTVKDAITAANRENIICGKLRSVNDIEFYNGSIAFIGDASSACSPMLQQGAASALEDAITLAHLLSNNSIEDALFKYKSLRNERVSWIVNKSDYPMSKIENGSSFLFYLFRNLFIKIKGPVNIQYWKKLFKQNPLIF